MKVVRSLGTARNSLGADHRHASVVSERELKEARSLGTARNGLGAESGGGKYGPMICSCCVLWLSWE